MCSWRESNPHQWFRRPLLYPLSYRSSNGILYYRSMPAILYLFLIGLEFIFLLSFCIFMFFLIYSHVKGSPYVPTKMKETLFILEQMKMKKNKVFYDLGCGDGRLVREAVKRYQVKGIGVDVNPPLILWSNFLAWTQKIPAMFLRKNIFDLDLSDADYVYIFLLPQFIKKLVPKFRKELKKNTLLVSHGFIIDEFKPLLEKKINHLPFPTYFYRMRD